MIDKTIWMPQYKAELVPFYSDAAFISITEPQRPDAAIAQGYVENDQILRLRFNDADEHFQNHVAGYEYDEPVLFTDEHANQIIDFVENLPVEVTTIFIHCHAGISRSAAVAIALAEMFGLYETYPNYKIYNKLVYRKLMLASADRYSGDNDE